MDINRFLSYMIDKDASDLFFAPGAPVLLKVHNETKPVNPDKIITGDEIKSMAYSLVSSQHIEQFETQWELNAGVTVEDIGRFRISLMKQRNEISMVIRLIHTEPPSIESLNLPPVLKTLVNNRRGLILVAGATCSGKSSTMAAMINHRNETQHGHILTIEDPLEFLHSYKKCIVNQRELGVDTHSYNDALKNAIREAPDVILIGEIRDMDTMKSAIAFAETGHLCIATIHASNCIETLDRVLNFFPQASHHQVLMDLSRNLSAVVCQRLIKGKEILWPAIELLTNSPYIQDLIQRGDFDSINQALSRRDKEDAMTFDSSLIALYSQGKISKEAAIEHADSKHNMTVQIRLLDERLHKKAV
ncbi:PilT/PilU family type 4a pilus ATPase [Litoribacillus peritrichatus]|uniref:PilT/PilU family type 4a pilus ATPase n=1 Tax=Litoribacillus peritrichatus TaxID=718191 RepID=A0ABP7M4X4_9GAMM